MKCPCCDTWQRISYIFIIIGALNWGLVGTLNLDLVALLFGDLSPISRTIYIIVAISAIVNMILVFKTTKPEK